MGNDVAQLLASLARTVARGSARVRWGPAEGPPTGNPAAMNISVGVTHFATRRTKLTVRLGRDRAQLAAASHGDYDVRGEQPLVVALVSNRTY